MSSKIALRAVTAAAGLVLCACAVGPNFVSPTASALKVPGAYQTATSTTTVDLAEWWARFDDPVLTDLVTTALAGNNDIDAARARLRVARASLRGARGALLPTLSATTGASRSDVLRGPGGEQSGYQAGLDAAWEADVFGGLRRSVEASRATAAGAQAGLADVRRAIAAELALDYIDLRATQNRLAITRANLQSQDETLQIVGWRAQAGLVGALDLEQARGLRAQTAAAVPQLETTLATDANRIAVLIGEAPGAVTAKLAPMRPIPLAPDGVEAGLPADLLDRRPDVLAAKASLAAETAKIGVARAQLYPDLRLSGSMTTSALSFASLGSSVLGNLAANITAPIFQGGQIRARIAGQTASADAALAAYRQTVLTALEDVENALISLDRSKARETQLAEAQDAAQNAALYAQNRYRAGLIDFQALLETQRTLLNSQDARTVARAARTSAAVQLYKALGGGWSIPTAARANSSTTRP